MSARSWEDAFCSTPVSVIIGGRSVSLGRTCDVCGKPASLKLNGKNICSDQCERQAFPELVAAREKRKQMFGSGGAPSIGRSKRGSAYKDLSFKGFKNMMNKNRVTHAEQD